ncbi:MAG: hypothetical protein J0L64_13660 [Acidobacteria bacterium]|nr:hypothetical protein [Acidobacteriota bacterium]
MYETKSVQIASPIAAGQHVRIVSVELTVRPSLPLAVAHYEIDGVRQPYGLRLDLGKRIMVDSLEDLELQDEARQCVEQLLRFMATEEGSALIDRSPSRVAQLRVLGTGERSASQSASAAGSLGG